MNAFPIANLLLHAFRKSWGRALALGVLLSANSSHAQWITQTFDLKAGWNAVFLHVDASHDTLQTLVDADSSNPIQEIWLWNPSPSTAQFIQSPQLPTAEGSQWISWVRSLGLSSQLQRLTGNAAYLVRVDSAVASYQWQLKGKPLAPRYQWTSSGLNFLGFPTLPSDPADFETFLSWNPPLFANAQIFRYVGGDLGPTNPQRLFAMRTTPVRRGEAFWIRAADYFNHYFGPVEIQLQDTDGVHFGASLGQHRLRFRNLVNHPVTVTLNLLPTENPPAAQEAIAGSPPILVRGALNVANLAYDYSSLNSGQKQWTLAAQGSPGSEIEVVLGVNRSQMTGPAGQLYAGTLRFSDSLNLSQIDIGVSARIESKAGLWIGNSSIYQVRHYLKNYQRDASGAPVGNSNGQYIQVAANTSYGVVSRNFPLRLIIHSDPSGLNAVLLQRAYYGTAADGNVVVATKESLLDPNRRENARRMSAAHLPWSEGNTPWNFVGEFRQGMSVKATVATPYNDHASNPFVHTYHPDHDNLGPTFTQQLPQGNESFSVVREITLTLTAPLDDFSSLTGSAQTISGQYEELITLNGRGSESRRFDIRGVFSLKRIADIPALRTQ